MDRVESFLKDELGLSLDTLGRERTLQKISQLISSAGFRNGAAFLNAASQDRELWQKLLDTVTVPESWFFRDISPFVCLQEWATKVRTEFPERKLRLLSVPCAAGEEVYSIAVSLRDAGLESDMFEVHGVDVNPRLIAKAADGQYGDHAFRGVDLTQYERYFVQSTSDAQRQVTPSILESVTLHVGNLFDLDKLFSDTKFDGIFCRNLLIYFGPESQVRALGTLLDRLSEDGVLFLGHAEASHLVLDRLASCGGEGSFAFRRRNPSNSSHHPEPNIPEVKATRITKGQASRGRQGVSAAVPKLDKTGFAHSHPRVKDNVLDELRQLADGGKIATAVQQCEMLLQSSWEDARVLFLCGVVNEASGDHSTACSLYRRALEVDPSYQEVMLHLAATLDAQGHRDEAAALKQKAQKLFIDETSRDG